MGCHISSLEGINCQQQGIEIEPLSHRKGEQASHCPASCYSAARLDPVVQACGLDFRGLISYFSLMWERHRCREDQQCQLRNQCLHLWESNTGAEKTRVRCRTNVCTNGKPRRSRETSTGSETSRVRHGANVYTPVRPWRCFSQGVSRDFCFHGDHENIMRWRSPFNFNIISK